MVRIKHWATRAFHEFLLARAHVPFAWGTHDCALFAADGIEALTGIDIASEETAVAAIRAIAGGTTVADAAAWCASKHGFAEWQHPLRAQRGDLVVYQDPVTAQLVSGLVHLSGRHIVAAGINGLQRISISRTLRAWHV
jgi:hypothetical protein